MEKRGENAEWIKQTKNKPTVHCVILVQPYQTVSVDGLANRVVLVALHQNPLRHALHEIQVLERGHGLVSLFRRRPPLVGGALQVVLEVHPHSAGQQVVHDHDADVLAGRLDAVEPVELGE